MKIAILTLGTRGDVQPYAVLGQALSKKGHDVVLATAKNFEGLVKGYGIRFIPVEADYQSILNTEEGKRLMKGNPFVIRRNLNKWVYPLVEQSLTAFYQLAKENDKVLYHVKTMADCFADQFPEKMIRAMVVPAVQATRQFPNPALSGIKFPAVFNRFSYRLTDLGRRMLKKPIRSFRMQHNLTPDYSVSHTPMICGISPTFLSQPDDYPPDVSFTGFWWGNTEENLASDLESFLNEGEAPLLITFGSMPFKNQFDLQKALLKAVKELRVRIIVVKGWGLKETSLMEEEPSIKVIDNAPYEKLFPKVKAVIHHGGIGTTSECIRAGRPFMVCPVLYPVGDQQFWGNLAFKKGVALKPVPLTRMTETDFIKCIYELNFQTTLNQNAVTLQKQLKNEDGVQTAIDLIEHRS